MALWRGPNSRNLFSNLLERLDLLFLSLFLILRATPEIKQRLECVCSSYNNTENTDSHSRTIEGYLDKSFNELQGL